LDIENGVNAKIDSFMKNFLFLYDDFVRAKTALSNENVDVAGLESILKNMNSFLSEYGVTPINALGEIFDPNFHEAISVVEDSTLDEGTITKEIRKGYISHNRVIRPTVVEISKKSNSEKSSD
jgi:molecular chaperone GrpE